MRRRWLPLLAAALALPLPLLAAPPVSTEQAQAEQQADLYEEAMVAIAEGRRGEASAILARMIAQGPDDPGSWMDLAMLQCALGHAEEAEQLFRSIEERFDPPPSVVDLIERQRQSGCAAAPLRSQWSLTTARGHESNVNQGASNPTYALSGSNTPITLLPEYLPQGDNYVILAADYLAELSQDGALGSLQLQTRHNDSMKRYDTVSLFGALDHPWRVGRWKGRATLSGGALTLDGRMYQRQAQLQVRAVVPLPLPSRWEVSVQGALAHLSYKTLKSFDANTGELRAVLSYRAGQRVAQFGAGALKDNATADRPGGDRRGWQANVSLRGKVWDKLDGELDLSQVNWRGQRAYAPGLIDQLRRQDTLAARATLLYPLSQRATLILDLRHVRNRENISIFEYNNNQVQLSLRWLDGK